MKAGSFTSAIYFMTVKSSIVHLQNRNKMRHSILILDLQYRDSENYKNNFHAVIDLEKYPEAESIYGTKPEDEVFLQMGKWGLITAEQFFGSQMHPQKYVEWRDHDLLSVMGVEMLNLYRDQMNVMDFAEKFGKDIEHIDQSEAVHLIDSPEWFMSLQTFGCTNYKDCRNYTKAQLIEGISEYGPVQIIHFFKTPSGIRPVDRIVAYGYRGGFSAIMVSKIK